MKEIVIASDHGGFELKEIIKEYLKGKDYNISDLGTDSEKSVDYPDFGEKMGLEISKGNFEQGILLCGSGIGMSIVVNKFQNVRGTLCHDLYTTKMSRMHNNSNILIIGGRIIGKGLALEMVDTWLLTKFEGGRHQDRLNKITDIENKELWKYLTGLEDKPENLNQVHPFWNK